MCSKHSLVQTGDTTDVRTLAFLFSFFKRFYLFIRETKGERQRPRQEGEEGYLQGAPHGT